MRTLIILSLIVLTVSVVSLPVEAQERQTITCPICNEPSKPGNNFCTSCGEKFSAAAVGATDGGPFTYREPKRLLSDPTASVLQELALGLTLGNSFGQQEPQSFLGNVSLGIREHCRRHHPHDNMGIEGADSVGLFTSLQHTPATPSEEHSVRG